MIEVMYGLQEWKDSYGQAEIADFKADDPDLEDWPLSKFLCGLMVDSEIILNAPESMQAALNLLDEEGHNDGFSAEFFTGVMKSSHGKTCDSFKELCYEHAEENYHHGEDGDPRSEFESFVSEDDFESWYAHNAVRDGEVYARDDAGGTLFWFNKNQW